MQCPAAREILTVTRLPALRLERPAEHRDAVDVAQVDGHLLALRVDIHLAEELQAGVGRQAGAAGRRFHDEARAAPLPALHAQVADDIDAAVRRNLAGLSETVLRGLAGELAGARRIHVFGMGDSSALFATELQQRLTRLGLSAAACSDAVAMRMLAATLEPGDVVLALSVSGRNPELLEAVGIAAGYGAVLGMILAAIIAPFTLDSSLGMAMLAGAVFGLVVYFFNFYVMTRAFPWFVEVRGWHTFVGHLIFGVTAAACYWKLESKDVSH